VKKIFEIALGIVTSVGGFLEIGSIVTAAQAGALFRFQLLWPIALGGLCVIFLVEMSGRLAAVSRHTIIDAMRERFGFRFFVLFAVATMLVMLLVLAAEIGGMAVALELATGLGFRWWAIPTALMVWLLIWGGTFGMIEKGTSLLGLVTLSFIVAVFKLGAPLGTAAAGLIPTLPTHDTSRYWFIVVSILGASITPYLFYFYSSGAVEDKWTTDDLPINRIVATLGMSFGSTISMAVLIAAAMIFQPQGISVDHYAQLPLLLAVPLGKIGFSLFLFSLGISCMGATLEAALELAYMLAQGFGWNWGEDERPRRATRFATAYTVTLLIAMLIIVAGINPLRLAILSMALTAATLPLAIGPFLVVMNDEQYLGRHRNGPIGNTVVIAVIALAFVLAVVTIPLEILGG
jgi:Mn2+/Fe2+ NRAMP family transporter